MNEENEVLNTEVYIPANFEAGINVMGASFDGKRLVEAVIESAIFALIGYAITKFLPITVRIGTVLALAGVAFAISVGGYHGDSWLVLLKSVLKSKKNRRRAYYNPRIKTEAVSIVGSNNSNEDLLGSSAADKLRGVLETFVDGTPKKAQEQAAKNRADFYAQGVADDMYFKDDNGVVNKPIEYMTKAERKAFEKAQKKNKREKKGVSEGYGFGWKKKQNKKSGTVGNNGRIK